MSRNPHAAGVAIIESDLAVKRRAYVAALADVATKRDAIVAARDDLAAKRLAYAEADRIANAALADLIAAERLDIERRAAAAESERQRRRTTRARLSPESFFATPDRHGDARP